MTEIVYCLHGWDHTKEFDDWLIAGLADKTYTREYVMECKNCDSSGWVCENHTDMPWLVGKQKEQHCGGAGMPCAICNPCDENIKPRDLSGSTPVYQREDWKH